MGIQEFFQQFFGITGVIVWCAIIIGGIAIILTNRKKPESKCTHRFTNLWVQNWTDRKRGYYEWFNYCDVCGKEVTCATDADLSEEDLKNARRVDRF